MLLAVVRHAKAEKQAASGRDEDRALTERGLRQAAFLAERLAGCQPRPDRVIASQAVRTRQTAATIARGCGVDFDFDGRLFVGRPVSGAMDLVLERESASEGGFLVLVGHNEQVSDLVNWLVGRGESGTVPRGWEWPIGLRTGQAVLLSPRVEGERGPGGWSAVETWRLDEE